MKTKFKLFESNTPPSGSFIVTVTPEDYNEERKTFSFEISTPSKKIGDRIPPAIVYLKSSQTGKYMKFFRFKTDDDGEGDVYGWWYKDMYEKYKLLIIND